MGLGVRGPCTEYLCALRSWSMASSSERLLETATAMADRSGQCLSRRPGQIPGEGSCNHSVVIPPPNLLVRIRFVRQVYPLSHLLGEAATCSEGFVICFLKSSPCLLGQRGSCRTGQQPGELSEKVNKTFETSGRPTRYFILICISIFNFEVFKMGFKFEVARFPFLRIAIPVPLGIL